ncbi:MAG: deoxyhypusine synthase family protein [Candidatus Hydrogenedentota bacterium]
MKKHEMLKYERLTSKKRKLKKQLFSQKIKSVYVKKGMKAATLVESMVGMSIQARNLGQCAQIFGRMIEDKERPLIIMGLAGPLIAAGLRKVIRDMVVNGYVDVVVSTGAIMYQDIYQALGYKHYKGTPDADDSVLRDLRIDRIYDTYVDEELFWKLDCWISDKAFELEPGNYSSREFMEFLGTKIDDQESIVYQASRLRVPIFVPALNDSSIGIGLTEQRHICKFNNVQGVSIDSIQDNYELTQIIVKSHKTAAVYVAGGVPKNYINDSVVMGYIFGIKRGHSYAIQISTAIVNDGGLSGSTLSEAKSWGKIAKEAHSCFAWVEPSVALPLLYAYVVDRFKPGCRGRLRFEWEKEILKSIKMV